MRMSCIQKQRVKPKVARLEFRARYQNIEDGLQTCGYRCLSGIHNKENGCPEYGKRGFKCHMRDHFAVVC